MHLYAPRPKFNSHLSVAIPRTNRIVMYLHGMVRLCEYNHDRLKILTQRRVDNVTGFVCSHDGKYVCIITAPGRTYLYVIQGMLLLYLHHFDDEFSECAFFGIRMFMTHNNQLLSIHMDDLVVQLENEYTDPIHVASTDTALYVFEDDVCHDFARGTRYTYSDIASDIRHVCATGEKLVVYCDDGTYVYSNHTLERHSEMCLYVSPTGYIVPYDLMEDCFCDLPYACVKHVSFTDNGIMIVTVDRHTVILHPTK